MKRSILAGLPVLLLCAAPAARADIAPRPNPFGPPVVQPGLRLPPAQKVSLVVEVDEKAKDTRLRIPVNLLTQNPALQPVQPGLPRRGADAGRLGLPTIVAGMALALALASGGLWLARRGAGRYLIILLVLSLFAAGTAAVWADLGPRPLGPRPPPRPVPPPQPALPQLTLPAGVELSDKVIIEIVPPARHLTLVVPKTRVIEKDRVGE
jgi:hypothetical protein